MISMVGEESEALDDSNGGEADACVFSSTFHMDVCHAKSLHPTRLGKRTYKC